MFDAIFAPQHLLDELGDRAWLQAMLDSERALAQAEAAAGLIPVEAVEPIAAACRADLYDRERIGREGRGSGNPAEPLVRALRTAVGGEAAGYVHYGATSQDIVDTAAMLVSRRALELVLVDVARVTSACAALAESHRATPMVARTLLQQALPTTFGVKAATWLVGVLEAQTLVLDARDRLAVQLGGAAGTLAALGDDGPDIARRMASELGLAEPVVPWHTSRVRVAALGSALAALAGALGKIALDVVLMAQTEVGELSEPDGEGRGGSSTLAHKRNPIGLHPDSGLRPPGAGPRLAPDRRHRPGARTRGRGLARRVGRHRRRTRRNRRSGREHVRGSRWAGGAPRAHARQPRGLARADHVRAPGLRAVGADRSRGRAQTRERGRRTGGERGTALRDELAADRRIPLTTAELDAAFVPETYVGAADVLIDRALDLYGRKR